MNLELLTPDKWSSEQKRLIGFAIRFGDKRLAVSTIHALRKLDGLRLEADRQGAYGAVVSVATLGGRLAGFGFASDGGESGCMVVVHPEARGLGVGSAIVQAMIQRLGRLCCNVATDNIASMSLCFRLGMTAVSMHKGPTGKPTLRFERGTVHDNARPRHSDFVSQ
ncbi:GNAT family N-acetyltransferase [Paenibacillus harenae]|uniref:GNAT family N-acetyltransferase n=1 Tax=Paenibacillus harenae TaxID=306543 RepID=UPI00040F9A3B|nr:GNAT family N-acetyltransferase [Paenibacillus harenae]